MSEVKVITCERCGSSDAIAYFPGSGCSLCESPRPKLGETSGYCGDNMHFHCHAEFDYDCGCPCHEYFDERYSLIKPMTEEYFITMVDKGQLSWIQLATYVPLEKFN